MEEDSGYTRRRFMGTTTAAAGSFLAGCSSSGESTTSRENGGTPEYEATETSPQDTSSTPTPGPGEDFKIIRKELEGKGGRDTVELDEKYTLEHVAVLNEEEAAVKINGELKEVDDMKTEPYSLNGTPYTVVVDQTDEESSDGIVKFWFYTDC